MNARLSVGRFLRTATRRAALYAAAVVCAAVGSAMLLTAQQPQAVGTWVGIGTVADARVGAASTVLPDGRPIAVTGGEIHTALRVR